MSETVVEAPAVEAMALPSAEADIVDTPANKTVHVQTDNTLDSKKSTSTSSRSNANIVSSSLRTALAATPSAIDDFLLHLHRCIKTRGGTDTVLLFTAYSARLTGAILEILSRTALRHSAKKVVEMAFKLPPSTSVVLATAPAPPLAVAALKLSQRLQALVGMLGEWRTMNRLWGILGMYMALKDLVLRLRGGNKTEGDGKTPPTSRFNTTVEALQVVALTIYHLGEATVWFGGKDVIKVSPQTRGRAGAISVRAWGAYVFMELGRLLVQRNRRAPQDDVVAEREWKSKWFTDFTHTLAWAPLTVHWSMAEGFLPEVAVGALAAYPSTALMKGLWRETA